MPKPSKQLLDEGFYEYTKKHVEGVCAVKFCTNPTTQFCLCKKHELRRWRTKNPKKAAYATLRDHARGRQLAFTISFDYFCGLTDSLAYYDQEAEGRGDIPTIDRVDATKGYVEGNLRVISLSENTIKGNRERFLPEHVRSMLERKRIEAEQQQPLIDEEPEDTQTYPYIDEDGVECPF